MRLRFLLVGILALATGATAQTPAPTDLHLRGDRFKPQTDPVDPNKRVRGALRAFRAAHRIACTCFTCPGGELHLSGVRAQLV